MSFMAIASALICLLLNEKQVATMAATYEINSSALANGLIAIEQLLLFVNKAWG
jgi:hypothetical protein